MYFKRTGVQAVCILTIRAGLIFWEQTAIKWALDTILLTITAYNVVEVEVMIKT